MIDIIVKTVEEFGYILHFILQLILLPFDIKWRAHNNPPEQDTTIYMIHIRGKYVVVIGYYYIQYMNFQYQTQSYLCRTLPIKKENKCVSVTDYYKKSIRTSIYDGCAPPAWMRFAYSAAKYHGGISILLYDNNPLLIGQFAAYISKHHKSSVHFNSKCHIYDVNWVNRFRDEIFLIIAVPIFDKYIDNLENNINDIEYNKQYKSFTQECKTKKAWNTWMEKIKYRKNIIIVYTLSDKYAHIPASYLNRINYHIK